METTTIDPPYVRHTKASVLVDARKRFGKNVVLDERKNAATAAEREADRERRKKLRATDEEIKAKLVAMGKASRPHNQLMALLEAVAFACDVDAQEPSLSKLKAARVKAKEYIDLCEARPDPDEMNLGLGESYRWSLWRVSDGPLRCIFVLKRADSLSEIAEFITSDVH